MSVHELSRADPRRIAVRAQLLDSQRPTDVLDVARHLTLVQNDLTATVAPNADLVPSPRTSGGTDALIGTSRIEQPRGRTMREKDLAFAMALLHAGCLSRPTAMADAESSGRNSTTRLWPAGSFAVVRATRAAIRTDFAGNVGLVLIDVRRGVRLGVSEKRATVCVPHPKPPPGTAFPPRHLTLRGQPVFELNLWCGTCPALFKKLAQPEIVDLGLANQYLNTGLNSIDDGVLMVYGKVLPSADYTVLLMEGHAPDRASRHSG